MDERFRILNTDTVLLLNEVMNADFQIQGKETTTDMCYAIQKIKEDAAWNATITATINTARRYNINESSILDDIMEQFKLTLEDSKAYMSGQKG